jgi:uncharacterized protein YdbL (DUF1318 family)
VAGEGKSESRNRNENDSSTKPGITNQVSCQKLTNNRTANADNAKNLTGHQTTLCLRHGQYWQKENT